MRALLHESFIALVDPMGTAALRAADDTLIAFFDASGEVVGYHAFPCCEAVPASYSEHGFALVGVGIKQGVYCSDGRTFGGFIKGRFELLVDLDLLVADHHVGVLASPTFDFSPFLASVFATAFPFSAFPVVV